MDSVCLILLLICERCEKIHGRRGHERMDLLRLRQSMIHSLLLHDRLDFIEFFYHHVFHVIDRHLIKCLIGSGAY